MRSFEMPSPASPAATSAGASQLRKLLWFAVLCTLLAAMAVPVCAMAEPASQTAAKKKKKKDKRPPLSVTVVTLDGDGDGRLDGIKITYNEKVRYAKLKGKQKKARAKSAFIVTGHKILAVKAAGNAVTLTVDESTKIDTLERPVVSYRRVKKGKKGVADRAGNQAFTGAIKARDGIGPLPTGARTTDSDQDGRLDGLSIDYSEPLQAADMPAYSVTGRTIKSAGVSGSSVQLSLEEAGVDSDARPPVATAIGAASDSVGNGQPAAQSMTATDGTPPAIVEARTADRDFDGRLDRIQLTFSEAITHPAETTGASLQVSGFTTTAVSAASGTTVDIDFNEGGASNTAAKPNVTSSTSGQRVTDLAGNPLPAGSYTKTVDGAAPVLVSARLRDTSANGRIDVIAATFSEPITFSAAAGAFSTTASSSVLGTLTSSGVALGSVVNMTVTEVGSCCNTNLPTVTDTVPVTYTPPGAGGVQDAVGQSAVAGSVNATDGSGPVINYAETEDADADGHIDRIYVGFSESVAQFSGSPLVVASGQRLLNESPGNQPVLISGGAHDGQIRLTLEEQEVDDTGDRPTVTYVAASGSYVRDAQLNDAVGSTAFTGTVDKASPVMRAATATDVSPLDGHIDTIMSVWSEPVATSASPSFNLIAQNPPSGYSAPTVNTGGATATGQTVTVPLNPSTDADRDVFFQVDYTNPGGVTDTATSPNPAVTPASFIGQTANCSDVEEAFGTHDDVVAHANVTGLQNDGDRHLATLCGADVDMYSFNVAADTVVKAIFSPTIEALSLPGRDGTYDPFTVSGPGSPAHTTTFVPGAGWTVEFQAGASGGNYSIGVSDDNSPLADFGYCIARSEGIASTPSCNLRQGDLAITEMLKDPASGYGSASRYIEVKNLTTTPALTSDLVNLQLDIGGETCTLAARGDTPASIPAGGYFVISASDIAGIDTDFDCSGMPAVDYGQSVSLKSSDGVVDAVNLGTVSVPLHTSVQVRSGTAFETSTGNDDGPGGWCASIDYHGTPGVANSQCDRFRLEEAMFMPSSASRDGRVMIELRGNAPINASSSLLAGWQIRLRPQTGAQKTFVLSAQANPNIKGFYVLADSPDAGGDTFVPFYSEQVSDLDDYLRADVPTTITLLPPGNDCVTGTPADTVGYVPGISGDLTGADDEGTCPAFIAMQFTASLGFTTLDTLQRKPFAAYSNNNHDDWCAHAPWTPMQINAECVIQQ